MTMLQTVEHQVKIKGANVSAGLGFIKVDREEDSDLEIGDSWCGPTSVETFGARAEIQKGKELRDLEELID
jgi:hypothetical protein